MLKIGHLDKEMRNKLRVLKCGAGDGWSSSVGPLVCEMKKSYIESRGERDLIHTLKRRRAHWIGQNLRRSCFLQSVIEGKMGW